MTQPFIKMHGIGNDFVVIDGRTSGFTPTPDQARAIGDRRTGVGFDQLAVIQPARDPAATAVMRIFNPDGSEAGACGNATRCVASLLMAETGRDAVVVQTISGLLPATVAGGGLITVDMGPARLDWAEIPLAEPVDTLRLPVTTGPLTGPTAVNMGNPHAVFFVDDLAAVDPALLGPAVERHGLFPQRTNVEFAQVLTQDRIRMRVWERGAGVTRACGSGACATLVAAARRGLTGRRAEIVLDGGSLTIGWRDDGHVLMTGPVATSFTGQLDPALLAPAGAG